MADEKSPMEKLSDVIGVASSRGNADYCEYMRGMANGLILAHAIMTGTEPDYIPYVRTEGTEHDTGAES